eukprot:1876047-Amphidinium_carterae.1
MIVTSPGHTPYSQAYQSHSSFLDSLLNEFVQQGHVAQLSPPYPRLRWTSSPLPAHSLQVTAIPAAHKLTVSYVLFCSPSGL